MTWDQLLVSFLVIITLIQNPYLEIMVYLESFTQGCSYFTKMIDISVYGKDVRQDAFNNADGKDILTLDVAPGFQLLSMGSVGIDTSK